MNTPTKLNPTDNQARTLVFNGLAQRLATSVTAVCLTLAAVQLTSLSAGAAPVLKAATGTNLLDGASWGGTAPTSGDVATWDSSSLGAGLSLASNTSWGGISVTAALTDISVTGAGVLTNGTSGIDLSASVNNMTWANGFYLGAAQTWNVASGKTLTVGAVNGTTSDLTKDGAGTLLLNGVANLANHNLAINSGTVMMAQDINSVGALSGTGTLETSGTGVNKWFFIVNSNDCTFSGTMQNYPGTTGRGMGLNKNGPGALTLNNICTINDAINVTGGRLNLVGTGVAITNFNHSANVLSVANATSARAVLTLSGGATLLANYNPANIYNTSAQVGSSTTSSGSLQMSLGTFNAAKQLSLAGGTTSYGAFSQSGGTSTIGGFLAMCVGATGSGAAFNQSGGSFTMSGAPATVGANASGVAVLNLSGTAAFTNNATGDNGLWFGENGTGALNISGNASLFLASGNNGLELGRNTGSKGTANLNGGTVTTKAVYTGNAGATSKLNFNGGTLKANAANAAFVTGLSGVYVYGGGATIDSGGYDIAVGQSLQAPSGQGVASIPVTAGGSNYIDTPLVLVTNVDGSGMTAIAQIDYTLGAVTNILITCPGNDYFTAPAVTLLGGGGAGATLGTPTLAANTSGGLTKTGNGTLTLGGGYSYTGPTVVKAGTLSLDASLSYPSPAGNLTVSNATLNLTLNNGYYSIYAANVAFQGTSVLNLNFGNLTGIPVAAINASGGSASSSGTTTINITGSGFGANTLVPLIYTGGSVSTANFVVGTLPPGISGVLTNTGTALGFYITSAGQLLTWYGADAGGATLTNWNINSSSNWNYGNAKYLQYAGPIGDNVTFDDNLYYTLEGTNVNLPVRVVPATVTVSSTYLPYNFTGAGGIDGTASLNKTNGGSLFLGTSNNYSGGTFVSGGSLIISNDNALGASAGGVNLSGGTLQINGNTASTRAIAVTANSSIGVASGATAQVAGAIGGSGTLTKTDNGTLTLSGNSTNQGPIIVGGGKVSLTGTVTPSAMTVGGAGMGVLDLSGTLTSSNLFVGNNSGVGAVYQTGGTVNLAGGTGDLLNLGNSDGTYGYYSAAGGTMNINGISIGGENNPNVWPPAGNNAYGLMEVNGATINNIGWIVLARGGANNIGVLNVFSGSLTYAGDGGIGCNWQLSGSDQTSIINVLGGSLTSTNRGVDFRTANTGILNLNGGVLKGTGITGQGIVNFNGGTLQPADSTGLTLTPNAIYMHAGGGKIDDTGYSFTVSKPLLAATGNGVSAVSIDNAGAGYIAPPVVTITGDGVGASAIAQINRTAGTVTNIIITCPGVNYTNTPIVTLTGGGGAGAAVSVTSLAANTSGGLTKAGAGTLTLTGTNTYTGATIVSQGTLVLTPAQQVTNSAVILSNAATLTISAVGNAATRVGNVTVGATAADNATIGFLLSTNPVSALLECGNLTLNGTNTIRVTGLLTAGTFPVLKYRGSFTGSTRLNPVAAVPHGYSGAVSNDNATSTIYVTVSGSGGIVWQGYATDAAHTNLWDINTTTNWLSGLTASTYFEGDKVIFNDTGSSLVLLSNATSPAGIVISNNSVNYTLQGPGQVGGVGGLTKVGSGSATVNFAANSYSGPTVVSNGTLNIVGGGAIGDSSAVTLVNAAGANLTVTGNETIASLAGGGAAGGNVSLSGTLTAGGNNASTTYAGAITGSGGLTKTGTGTLSLSGAYSAGDVSVPSGSLTLTGSGGVTSPRMFVAASSGTTATVNMNTGTTLTNNYNAGGWWVNYSLALGVDDGHEGTLNMSGGTVNETGRVWVGNWGGTGHWNQTGGTANISAWIFVGGMQDNNAAQPNGSIGTAIVSNATLSAGNVVVGAGGAGDSANPGPVATSRVKGDMTVANGGVVNSEGDLQVGRSGEGSTGWGSYGTLNIGNGGIVNVASTTERWMTVGRFNSIDATVNIKSGGTLNLNAGTDLQINEGDNSGIRVVNVEGLLQGTAAGGSYIDLNRNANTGGTTTFNITNGGVVAVDSIIGKANCTLNFNNGTLKATADDTNFIGSGFTVNILAGGAILNTDGHNPTVVASLLEDGASLGGGVTKTGAGTLNLNGINSYVGTTTVSNGALGGIGTIQGPVVVTAGAALAPGASIGTLTINNNLTLAGNLLVEVNTGVSPSNDLCVVTGTATYTGTGKSVIVTNEGSALNVGDTFKLFSGVLVNGQNLAITGVPGVTWTNELATLGQIRVLSVAPPIPTTPTNIVFSLSGSNLTLSWPSNYTGWTLQSQTNSRSIGISTNWADVPGSSSVYSTNFPVNPTNPTVFYRLKYTY